MTHLQFLVICILFGNCFSCPPPEVISPCKCYSDGGGRVICGDHKVFDLKKTFERWNKIDGQKHYHSFKLANTDWDEGVGPVIEANLFGNITFSEIDIRNLDSLTKIHADAFISSVDTLEKLVFQFNHMLRLGEGNDDYNFLKSLDKFNKLQYFYFDLTVGPKFVPRMFKSKSVTSLSISVRDNMTSIGEYAFEEMEALTRLDISYTEDLKYIGKNAFAFKNNLSRNITIGLSTDHLNGSSFEEGCFTRTNGPMRLQFFISPYITYLDEKVFKPVLIKETNFIDMGEGSLDCQDCRNSWIRKMRDDLKDKNRLFRYRLDNIYCIQKRGKRFKKIFDDDMTDLDDRK